LKGTGFRICVRSAFWLCIRARLQSGRKGTKNNWALALRAAVGSPANSKAHRETGAVPFSMDL
jgi:hypothetical protein